LRDYQVEPTVWDGDPGCDHTFETQRYYTERAASRSSGEAFSEAGADNAERVKAARWHEDACCTKCGAWRGCLGLEPTPDCGRPFMEMRPDLTDKEREYVLAELRRLGLLDEA